MNQGKFSDYVVGLLNAFVDTLPSFKGTPVHQALFSRDAEGYTLLHHAVLTNHTQLLQAIISILVKHPNGIRVINAVDKSGLSPLHWAVIRRCENAISLLVEHGHANLNIQNLEGRTPLSFAVDRFSASEQKLETDEMKNQFDLQLTLYLLSRGASPHIADVSGTTPLQLVSSFGDVALMRTLINAGASINNCDAEGEHALFYAIRSGSLEAVKLLVEVYQVDLFTESHVKETPLEAAIACADAIICDYLRSVIISSNNDQSPVKFSRFQESTGLSRYAFSDEETRRNSTLERMEVSSSMLPQENSEVMDKENNPSMSLSAGAHWSKLPAFSAQSAF